MLVDGKWSEAWRPVDVTDAKGGFVRQVSGFRDWVTADGAAGPTGRSGFRAERGRYHLYASFGCPWATRVLIARKLKRLEDVISVAIVEPVMTDQGWRFGDGPGADHDSVNGATYLHEIYTRADRISPAVRPFPPYGTSSAGRSSITNPPTFCACSTRASAPSPTARSIFALTICAPTSTR